MNNIFGMFNASITSLNVISVNSRDWKPAPKSWFSRNHNAGLNNCFINREDSLQARYRVLMHLKELHEEQYPEGPRPHYIESDNVGAGEYIESDNVGAGEPAYGESDVDSDGDTVISPPAIRTDQLRNPGEMPDLRRPDLQIETPADTQPTNVTVSDSTTCGICWDELGEANVMVTKCGHKFCCDCILSHFQNAAGTNCPLCREEYAKRVPGWLPPQEEDERPRRARGRPRRQRNHWVEPPYVPPSNDTPNVALLNIGSEELKGSETIKDTYQKLNEKKNKSFDFEGFIEGNEIMNGKVNVIVSDGFTGNVALKTAEGTANFITDELKKALGGSILGKISSLLNISNLKKFKKRLDPRLYNGAIFIGLDTPVVKSHGGTDFIGFSNSLDVCNRIVKGNLIDKINSNI